MCKNFIQALAEWLAVVNFKTLEDQVMLKEEEVEALIEFLAEVNVYMVMDTLSDTLAKAEIDTGNGRKARRITS